MKLQHLHEFAVLAENGSYMPAAEELFISQATLSRHIKSLEDSLGVTLFKRTAHKLELTDYGTLLLPYAQKISAIEQNYMADLFDLRTMNETTLCIGVSKPLDIRFDDMLRHVDMRTNAVYAQRSDRLWTLLDGLCDFIFLHECRPYRKGDFGRVTISRDILCVALPSSHPLAEKSSIRIEWLKGETFFMLAERIRAYQIAMQLTKAAGFEPKVLFYSDNRAHLLHLLNQGNAVSILMPDVNNAEYSNVSFVPIDPPVYMEFNCVFNTNQATDKKHKQFLNALSSFCTEQQWRRKKRPMSARRTNRQMTWGVLYLQISAAR